MDFFLEPEIRKFTVNGLEWLRSNWKKFGCCGLGRRGLKVEAAKIYLQFSQVLEVFLAVSSDVLLEFQRERGIM